jgi:hypothetical protein
MGDTAVSSHGSSIQPSQALREAPPNFFIPIGMEVLELVRGLLHLLATNRYILRRSNCPRLAPRASALVQRHFKDKIMTRLLTTSAAALVLFGTSLASAQYVPGSDATSRASGFAERQRVAAGYPDAVARPAARTATTFGYPAAERTGTEVPGSEFARTRAEEAARADIQRRSGAAGF